MAEIYRRTVPKAGQPTDVPAGGAQAVTTAEQAYTLARRMNDLGKPDEAIPMLETALALDAGHVEAVVELGATFADIGEPERSFELLEDFLRNSPRATAARLQYARCLMRQGRLEPAVREYAICAREEPSWEAPYLPMISALCRLGRHRDAAECFEKLSQRPGVDPRTLEVAQRILDRGAGV